MENLPIELKKKFFFIVSCDDGEFPNRDFTLSVNDSAGKPCQATFSRPSPASVTAMMSSLSWNAKNAVRDAIAPQRPLPVTRVSQGPAPGKKTPQEQKPKPKAPVVPVFAYDRSDPMLKQAWEASEKAHKDLSEAIDGIKRLDVSLGKFSTKGDFKQVLKSKVDGPTFDRFVKLHETNDGALKALKLAKLKQLEAKVQQGDPKAIAFKKSLGPDTSKGAVPKENPLSGTRPVPEQGTDTLKPSSGPSKGKKNNGLDG